jgi:hypothetical protein
MTKPNAMKEVGLLYTLENRFLVRAGFKTQTRRIQGLKGIVADQVQFDQVTGSWCFSLGGVLVALKVCPFGNPEIQAVRYHLKEPVMVLALPENAGANMHAHIQYPDTGDCAMVTITPADLEKLLERTDWRKPTTSMHMLNSFRQTCMQGVRTWPEQLGAISEDDAIAEGIEIDPTVVVDLGDMVEAQSWAYSRVWRDYLNGGYDLFPVQSYASLWDSINGAGSWHKDTWVWCVKHSTPDVKAENNYLGERYD